MMMPDEFKGSVMNLSLRDRLLFWTFGFLLPMVLLSLTIPLIFLTELWPVMLVPDLISLIIALSLSGTLLRGHSLAFESDGLAYTRGWRVGRIPFSSIRSVYRVRAADKSAIMIVFTERTGPLVMNSCFAVEQVFQRSDRDAIFRKLAAAGRNRYKVVDEASIEQISAEKDHLGWSTV